MTLTDYIAGLTVTQGSGAGSLIRLLPWQKRFLRGAFAVDGDAALAISRGNGKSTIVAAIACAVIDGPLRQPRAEVVCVASSFSQGRIIYEHVRAFLEALGRSLGDRSTWRVQDSANTATIEHRPSGSRVRCIGSDPKRAHGLAPLLVLADEPAQWEHTKRDAMRAALMTAMGKLEGSRMIALGTRPADESHWFAKMLDGGADYSQSHHATESDPPFQRRTWLKANPSLPVMPSLEKRIRMEAKDASRDDSMLASFKALRLNMGTDDVERSTLLDASTWKRITGDAPREGSPIWGLDLGQSEAMAAVSAYYPMTGRLEAVASFASKPDLAERGKTDSVGNLYERMARRGELICTGGSAIDIPELLRHAWMEFGAPCAIGADRWRVAELRDILQRIRLPFCNLHERGQGFKDGGEDVRLFRKACITGLVVPVPSLLLTAAMREARTVGDPAGNHKLAKSTQGGRRKQAKDDAAASSILAVALGSRMMAAPPPPSGLSLGRV